MDAAGRRPVDRPPDPGAPVRRRRGAGGGGVVARSGSGTRATCGGWWTWSTRSTGRCAAPGCWSGRPRWRPTTGGRCRSPTRCSRSTWPTPPTRWPTSWRPTGWRSTARPALLAVGRRDRAGRADRRARRRGGPGAAPVGGGRPAAAHRAWTRWSPPTRCRRRRDEPGRPASDRPPGQSWVLHVDLDQFIAAVEVLRRPELAGLPGGGRRPRRPDRARAWWRPRRTRPGSSASAPGCRCGWPRASARTRCSCRSTTPAYDAASAEVMDTLRVAGVGRRAGGASRCSAGTRRSWRPGRGGATAPLGRPAASSPSAIRGRGAGGDPAALLGRHRRQQAAGQDRHRLRQAARGLPADRRRTGSR